MDSSSKKKKVLCFAGDMGGCCHYRLLLPAYGLLSTGRYDCRVSMIIDKEKFEWDPDILVFARQHKPDVQRYMKMWKDMGKTLIYDVDDDLIHVPSSNPAYESIRSVRKEIFDTIKICDKLTVSTQPLKDLYSQLNPNIDILPNQISSEYGALYEENTSGTLRIGWAGTNTHAGDFKYVEHAIIDIASKYDNVKFVFFGWVPEYLEKELPSSKLEYVPGVSVDKYHACLGKLGLDIGLAPLDDNAFNQGKSNLKILEYGIMGVPTIASPVYPYSKTIVNGENGLIAKKNKHKSWVACMSSLIEDTDRRKDMGKASKKYVLDNFNILNNVGMWETSWGGE